MPAPCIQHHLPCTSISYPRPILLLYLSPQVTPKVSLAQGRARGKKKLLGSGAKQDHLIEVLGLPTGFLLILREQKPEPQQPELPATTARQLNNNNLQTSKVKPNEQL